MCQFRNLTNYLKFTWFICSGQMNINISLFLSLFHALSALAPFAFRSEILGYKLFNEIGNQMFVYKARLHIMTVRRWVLTVILAC